MNKKGILACLLVLVVIFEEGQTAHTTIPVLKVKAEREVYSILTEILELESYTVRHHRQAHTCMHGRHTHTQTPTYTHIHCTSNFSKASVNHIYFL